MLALTGWVLVLGLQVDDKAADEAVDRFRKGMANPNASARASAVLELSRVPHDKTLKNLLPCLTADVKDVRKAAAKGLGGFADWKKVVTPALTAALGGINAKEAEVRCEIFGALGKLADPLALSTVHGAFKDDDVRVAQAAIGAAGGMRQKESIDALLDLQKQIQKWLKNKQAGPYRDDKGQQGDERAYTGRLNDVQKTILDAFKKITLERWGSAQEWEIWWNKKKAGYEVPPAPEEKK
jgi:HEAT repeat protein